MLSCLTNTHMFKQGLSFGFRVNYFDSRLTHITFYRGACSYHLGLEQLKDRTVKSSTMLLTL